MPEYTVKNLKEIEDSAVKFGLAPNLEAHFASGALECEKTGISYQRLKPNVRGPFGHKHDKQEEIYVIVGGRARGRRATGGGGAPRRRGAGSRDRRRAASGGGARGRARRRPSRSRRSARRTSGGGRARARTRSRRPPGRGAGPRAGCAARLARAARSPTRTEGPTRSARLGIACESDTLRRRERHRHAARAPHPRGERARHDAPRRTDVRLDGRASASPSRGYNRPNALLA